MPREFKPISLSHPEIAAQAYGWDPSTLSSGSNKVREWECPAGHVYDSQVAKRTMRGQGCPFCSGHRVLAGFNDISTTHPEIAKDANGWDPTTISAGSNKKLSWKCPVGHIYESLVADRTSQNARCPICLGRKVLAGFNDLTTTHPELAKEAHGWNPETRNAGSNKRAKWKCPEGHIYESVIASRAKGSGCHFCSGHRVLAGHNDLVTTHPELAEKAYGWDPRTVSAGSNRKLMWRCNDGHTFEAVVTSRLENPNGCPICYGRTALPGCNDLATVSPELASEAYGWDPTTLTRGSGEKREWQCSAGHIYRSTVADRSSGNGCPICSGHQVLAGFNDLLTTHPQIAAEADGWDPTTLNAGSNKKRQWKCGFGHTWSLQVNQRTSNRGCPFCTGSRVLAGFNDLTTTHPDIAEQAHEWDPTTRSRGSDVKASWICDVGHIYRAAISARVAGTGCPTCANFGFSPGRDGWVYLISNKDLGLLQIGITNTPEQRLKQHQKSGFDQLLDIRGPMDGQLARSTENAILNSLKKRNAIFSMDHVNLRFSGFTESWAESSISVSTIRQLLDFVEEDEESDSNFL
jgi:hypothetical protein